MRRLRNSKQQTGTIARYLSAVVPTRSGRRDAHKLACAAVNRATMRTRGDTSGTEPTRSRCCRVRSVYDRKLSLARYRLDADGIELRSAAAQCERLRRWTQVLKRSR